MELTNLLDRFGTKPENPPQFLALELTDDIVRAAVWQIESGVAEIVALGSPVPWNGDEGNLEELVIATDNAITKACEALSSTPDSIIFGIPTAWIQANTVVASKRQFLKEITQKLELKALGYIIVADSVIKYLRTQEGTPLSALLIQVADTELTLILSQLGKVQFEVTIPRTDDIASDIEQVLLKHPEISPLPSRFLVFDGMHDLDEIVQNLTLVDWSSHFHFLHIPKIEALNSEVVIKALCLAGGSEVAKSIGIPIVDPPPTQVTESAPVTPESSTEPPAAPTSADDNLTNVETADLAALGFATSEAELPVETAPQPVPARRLPAFPTLPQLKFPSFRLPRLTNLPQPRFHLPLWVAISSVVLATLFFVVAGSLWLFPKASITLFVQPQLDTVQFTAKLDNALSEPDLSNFTLPYTIENTTATQTLTLPTTGTKTVGEPSRGTLTLYNRTAVPKAFAKGTLASAGKLKFSFDSDVTVASRSAGADYVDVPGKSEVKITAEAIGDAGNLPAGTEFTIGNFGKESYVGKNDAALKGGTSRSVSAVSAKDKTTLLDSLKQSLAQTAASQLTSASDFVFVLPDGLTIDSETYSAKVGEEATELTATLAATARGYQLSQSQLLTLAKQVVATKYGSNSQLVGEPTLSLQEGTVDSVIVNAQIQLLPSPDLAQLSARFANQRRLSDIEAIAGSVPGFQSIKVTIEPRWLPSFLKSLPRQAQNIAIQLVPTP